MTIPPFLKIGDTVGLIAPSGYVDKSKVDFALKVFESWNLKVVLGQNIYNRFKNFAATDSQRLSDLQHMLDDDNIKAVFCIRGGYGLIRIIDKIDFSKFATKPKLVVGFSDITVLHSALNNNFQIASIHGPMPASFERYFNDEISLENLKKMIFGETINYKIPFTNNLAETKIEGKIFGGNLSILNSLSGTNFDYKNTSEILFIEDVGEHFYHIDRMINNLYLSGKLGKLKAIILGDFSDMKDDAETFGYSVEQMIETRIGKQIPILKNLTSGHAIPNLPLFFGTNVSISVTKNYWEITQN